MSREAPPFRKGDKVAVVLRCAGVESREEGYEVYRVSRGLAYVTDGENVENYPYDATTGKLDGHGLWWLHAAAGVRG